MTMTNSWLPLLLCGGCSAISGIHSTNSNANGAAIVPNVVLMPRAEAEAALRAAGFTAPVELDSFACGSTVDNKIVVEKGHVCYQMPAAGRQGSLRIPVTLRVQHEDPWRGTTAGGRTWFLMPDFSGVPMEAARVRLRELGFTKEPLVSFVQEPGCRANVVCRTSPDPLTRADTTSDKILFVGQAPSAGPERAPTSTTPRTEPAKDPGSIF